MDPERQRLAREYARIRRRMLAAELLLTGAGLLVVLITGLSTWLRDLVLRVSPDPWVATLLYSLLGLAAYGILFLPLSYASSFVLPHRYGLSVQSLRSWLGDMVKGGLLAAVLGGIVIEAIYFVLRTAPDLWWLYAAGLMLLFTVLLANLAPVLIFPIFFRFKPLEDPDLVGRLVRLAGRAHTRVGGVYTMMLSEKTTAANAALMGLGNTRRIVLGDTLYQNYSHDQIETILAHELGHLVHNDIVYGIAVEAVLTLAGFLAADRVLREGVTLFHFQSKADLAALPLFGLALSACGLLTGPIGNAYSRWRERRADEYALEATGNPAAFIGAMEKLAGQNLAELEPEPWVEWLLYDHPALGKRLELGRRYAAAQENKRE